MRIPVLVHGRVRGGQEWGRQGRPAKPAGPSSWKRRYHRQVVIAEIPISGGNLDNSALDPEVSPVINNLVSQHA